MTPGSSYQASLLPHHQPQGYGQASSYGQQGYGQQSTQAFAEKGATRCLDCISERTCRRSSEGLPWYPLYHLDNINPLLTFPTCHPRLRGCSTFQFSGRGSNLQVELQSTRPRGPKICNTIKAALEYVLKTGIYRPTLLTSNNAGVF